jgi:hypothetical protein|tara:strand:+ start:422 stop:802 length:381 start_codon:yes stop_codon:yes gene_type:complete
MKNFLGFCINIAKKRFFRARYLVLINTPKEAHHISRIFVTRGLVFARQMLAKKIASREGQLVQQKNLLYLAGFVGNSVTPISTLANNNKRSCSKKWKISAAKIAFFFSGESCGTILVTPFSTFANI